MKALILPFVIAIVIGVGSASAVSVIKAKKTAPPAVADSAKLRAAKDTSGLRVIDASGTAVVAAAPAGAARDSAKTAAGVVAATADTTKPAQQRGAATAASQPPAALHTAVPGGREPVSAGAVGAAPPAQKRISRVFAAMAPRDAAKVLEQMNDADVSIILGNLTEKQTGAIMALLPAPRVAALSRGALRSSPGAK
jgi:hypothetical protein